MGLWDCFSFTFLTSHFYTVMKIKNLQKNLFVFIYQMCVKELFNRISCVTSLQIISCPFLQWWEVIVSYYMVVGFVYTVKPNMSKPYLLKTNEIDRYSVYIICKFYFGMDTRRIVILHHLEQKIVCMVHISSTDNRIGGVMVSMLASSVVDCGFEPLSGQTQWLILVFVTYPLRTTCFKE